MAIWDIISTTCIGSWGTISSIGVSLSLTIMSIRIIHHIRLLVTRVSMIAITSSLLKYHSSSLIKFIIITKK